MCRFGGSFHPAWRVPQAGIGAPQMTRTKPQGTPSHGAQQGELVAGAGEVVAFVVGAEIDAAEEVVGEEADGELKGDDFRGGWQECLFLRSQETGGGG